MIWMVYLIPDVHAHSGYTGLFVVHQWHEQY